MFGVNVSMVILSAATSRNVSQAAVNFGSLYAAFYGPYDLILYHLCAPLSTCAIPVRMLDPAHCCLFFVIHYTFFSCYYF